MSDRKKQLNNDDLLEVKTLIGDASGNQFSLDDILAEFGSRTLTGRGAVPVPPKENEPARGSDLPWPEPPRTQKREEKVVTFPGAVQTPPRTEEAPEGERAKQPGQDSEEAPEEGQPFEEENGHEDRVLSFPEEESALSTFLKDMGRKADDYADRMFEEDERIDPEEVRRLERLIPGTDQEEQPGEDFRRFRRASRPEPPPPDRSPQELARACGQGLKGMRIRTLLVFLLTVLALVQMLVPAAGLAWASPLNDSVLQIWIAAGLLGLGTLLGMDVLLSGLGRAVHGKVGMDTLAAFSCLFTLADGAVLALMGNPEGRLPYSVVALAGLWALLHGTYHKKCGLRLSCRTAAASSQPYRVTLDEGKWNGRDTYVKWAGTAEGFGSQIQADDGAQRIFRRYCPLLLLGDLLLALLATAALGRPEELLWGLSALFTVTAAFGGALAYGRSFHKVARRLVQSGAALAGWPGVTDSKRGDRVLITDTDLFPTGYVELNGYKVLGDFPIERVVAYTATLIRDSGSGLAKLFHDQLRALGGLMRNADRLCCYEGGGLSANIRGDEVLVGSAAFMNLMEIQLPPGLNVKNAVFCAINGELAGIFALSYSLPDTAFPSLEELMHEKVGPVLATRDFNLIPAMLHQRFKLAADKMDFPPVERRRELSDPEQPHSEVLTALLCREGLFPFAEAVVAAKRLRWATCLGAVLCCVGATLGLLLSAYLVSVSAFGSLSPLNLLIYMVTWLAPVWLLSGWVHRY
ncbi:MAG: hypothetical protein AB7E30_02085 [Lawsonibacter sp.]